MTPVLPQYTPTAPTLIRSPFHRPGWVYEEKVDVAKDDASPYVGGFTRSWLKVKVPGWTDPEDRWQPVLTRA